MTREEAKAYFKRHIDLYCVTGICREAEEMAIQALEQEPSVSENPNNCEMRDATPEERESIDKYIKSISKPTGVKFGALEQEPSDDCISRQAVLDKFQWHSGDESNKYLTLWTFVENMPSIKPQTGHWIDADGDNAICSCCNRLNHLYGTYCKHCGARMVEPQERSEE